MKPFYVRFVLVCFGFIFHYPISFRAEYCIQAEIRYILHLAVFASSGMGFTLASDDTLLHCSLALSWSSIRGEGAGFCPDLSCPGGKERTEGGGLKSWLSSLQPFPLLSFAASTAVSQRDRFWTLEKAANEIIALYN